MSAVLRDEPSFADMEDGRFLAVWSAASDTARRAYPQGFDRYRALMGDIKPKALESGQPGLPPLRALTTPEFLRTIEPPTYALDGVLISGYCFALTAPSGHGKTAVALLLATCAVVDLPFAGLEVMQGRVLYVAGENPDDIRMRMFGMLAELDVDADEIGDRLQFVDESFTLAGRHGELVRLIEDGGFNWVFLDTDQALSSDADENDNRERIEHAKRVRALSRAATRPTVIDLCHPPGNAKRDALRPRGGSSFLAEIDGNLGAWMNEGEARTELFRTAKFRGPQFDPIAFDIKVVEIEALADSKGRPMTTAIAVPAAEAEPGAAESQRQRRLLLLRDISATPSASVRDRAHRLGVGRSTVQRDLAYLVERGAIVEALEGHEMTTKGKKWAAQ